MAGGSVFALNLGEMHGAIRDLVQADGLLQHLDAGGRRVGISEVIGG